MEDGDEWSVEKLEELGLMVARSKICTSLRGSVVCPLYIFNAWAIPAQKLFVDVEWVFCDCS